MEPHNIEAQCQSTKVSFVGIYVVEVKLPGNNQRVSNSVFKVTRIIYIVDSVTLNQFQKANYVAFFLNKTKDYWQIEKFIGKWNVQKLKL